MVPATGQYPSNTTEETLRYLTTGPLTRHATDLMPLLRILAGPDGEDVACQHHELGDPESVDMAGLRVISVPDNGRTPVSNALRRAQERCGEALARRGARVEEIRFEGLERSFDIWSSMLGGREPVKFRDLLRNGRSFVFALEFMKWLLRLSPHTLPAIVLASTEWTATCLPSRTRKFIALGDCLRDALVTSLREDGVMLMPSYSSVAPGHYRPLLRPLDFVYTGILNVMGLPVTQVPLGVGARGLPLGVQVVASHAQDHRAIAVARVLEEEFGGWVYPYGRS